MSRALQLGGIMATNANRSLGWVPLVLGVVLAAFWLRAEIRTGALMASFGAVSVLVVSWSAMIVIQSARRSLKLTVGVSSQDLLPTLAWLAVLGYWSAHWEPLRQAAPLVLGQLVFAYALDMLVTWSKRDTYSLDLGPALLVLSTNAFMRFRDEWFYLQFLLIAVGLLTRDLFRWRNAGRQTNVFSPSCLSLAVFSVALLTTNSTHLTWAEDLATFLFLPPKIYLAVFVVSLPVLFVRRTVPLTLLAVLTTYGCSALYLRLTGTYLFIDSTIPITAFLGMHLLLVDSPTLPRTELGRILFGAVYGASIAGLYWLLRSNAAPTFASVWLAVPMLNLLVNPIDRLAESRVLSWLRPERIGKGMSPTMRSVGYTALWVVTFSALSAAREVGDYHVARTVPFLQQSCRDGRPDGCKKLEDSLNKYCVAESGWACNELGIRAASGQSRPGTEPQALFDRGCGFGQREACDNAKAFAKGARDFRHGEPTRLDFPLILRQGDWPIPETTEFQLYTRACNEGWASGCDRLAVFYFRGIGGIAVDKQRSASLLQRACDGGIARSCANLGLMYKNGDGVPKDTVKALEYLNKSCDLGSESACRWLADEQAK